jgi:hypothetical protein
MPAGFTDDGVPIGVELLGPGWSEGKLLALAFAYEQATHPRRVPLAAPALADGKAPSPLTFVVNLNSAHTTFTFDPIAGTLAWDVTATKPLVATVHRGRQGPALATLITNKSTDAAGVVNLLPDDRTALRAEGLFLLVRTMESPGRVERAPLRVTSK